MRNILIGACVALLTLEGCKPGVTKLAPEFEPGLKAFPTPRAYDAVGTVIRVDPSGVSQEVTSLTLSPPAQLRPEVFPAYTKHDTVSAQLLLDFLRAAAGNPSVGAALGKSTDLSFQVQGTQRELSNDGVINAALAPALPQINFLSGNKYYVITQTVLADSIAYTVRDANVDSLGGGVNLQKVATGKVGVHNVGASTYAIVAKLQPAMRVFYKVEEIAPKTAGLSGGRPVTTGDIILIPDNSNNDLIRDH